MTSTHASKASGGLIARKPRIGSILCLLFLFAAISVTASHAQNPLPPEPFLGAVSFYFDNDVFSGNDNKYTGGLGLSWTSAAAETYEEKGFQRKIVNAFSFLPTVNDEGYRNYIQFMLGMEAYTPSDIRALAPPFALTTFWSQHIIINKT